MINFVYGFISGAVVAFVIFRLLSRWCESDYASEYKKSIDNE